MAALLESWSDIGHLDVLRDAGMKTQHGTLFEWGAKIQLRYIISGPGSSAAVHQPHQGLGTWVSRCVSLSDSCTK